MKKRVHYIYSWIYPFFKQKKKEKDSQILNKNFVEIEWKIIEM